MYVCMYVFHEIYRNVTQKTEFETVQLTNIKNNHKLVCNTYCRTTKVKTVNHFTVMITSTVAFHLFSIQYHIRQRNDNK